MDPASISALLSGGSSLISGLSGLFGDDGSDAMDRALDMAKEQYQQGSQAQETAARRELALYDPFYQSNFRAYNNYLRELGQDYITDDPVMASMRHNADNYIAVGPDGRSYVVDTIPGYTGGNTPRPLGTTPQQPQNGGNGNGGPLSSLFGIQGGNGNGQGSAQPTAGGMNFSAGKGQPIGTVNGTTYYRRDEDSLMPYNWAEGSGQRGGPNLSAGNYQQSPGYGFQVEQGVKALDRSAAANGRLNSGRQAMELTRFGQGVANQDYYGWADREQQKYDNWLGRLGQLAGQAPVAAGQVGGVYGGLGQAGANSSGQLADLALSRGMTDAGSANRSQSAFQGGLGNVFSGLGSLSTLFR